MDKKYIFPKDFWWGSATSGPQSEGDFNKPHKSVFDYWYEVEPEAFFDRVGPSVTSNFYNSYKEDLAIPNVFCDEKSIRKKVCDVKKWICSSQKKEEYI